jgi:hypothetical protein
MRSQRYAAHHDLQTSALIFLPWGAKIRLFSLATKLFLASQNFKAFKQ